MKQNIAEMLRQYADWHRHDVRTTLSLRIASTALEKHVAPSRYDISPLEATRLWRIARRNIYPAAYAPCSPDPCRSGTPTQWLGVPSQRLMQPAHRNPMRSAVADPELPQAFSESGHPRAIQEERLLR